MPFLLLLQKATDKHSEETGTPRRYAPTPEKLRDGNLGLHVRTKQRALKML
jgi:hypothetical protein